MAPPLILCTNDDGIHAPGLWAAVDALRPFGRVVVVAPDGERSACGHALTLHQPLRAWPLRHFGTALGADLEKIPEGFAVSGSPADCVYLAFHHLLDRPPTLTVSGINAGPNLGGDVVVSGTCAAARESMFQGVPGIAASLAGEPPYTFTAAAKTLARIVERVLARPPPQGIHLNVNFPTGPAADEAPWEVTRLGRHEYRNFIVQARDPREKPYYWIGGLPHPPADIPGTDGHAVRQGRVSITPLGFDLTADPALRATATQFEAWIDERALDRETPPR